MPDNDREEVQTVVEQAPDQSKNATVKAESEAQPEKSVSGAAFNKAIARVTAEKWDLKRQLEEERKKNAELAAAMKKETPANSTDQEYETLLGDHQEQYQASEQSDIDIRIARLENAEKLQQAANQLQELMERYPGVDPDKVLAALQKDGRGPEELETYYLAERGRNADVIRAQRDAEEARVDKQVADGSTEGPSRPAGDHDEIYSDIPDDVEAFRQYRRDKAAGKI